jgi:hypothetical protein
VKEAGASALAGAPTVSVYLIGVAMGSTATACVWWKQPPRGRKAANIADMTITRILVPLTPV